MCPPPHYFALTFAMLLSFNMYAQMDYWILNPHEIDFDAGTAVSINTGASYPYMVENAVYKDGVLQFYVNDGSAYNAAGNNIGQYAFGYFLKEVAIAPLPGDCDQWCLFWAETSPLASLVFRYQEVKMVNGDAVLGSAGIVDNLFGNNAGVAVSHIVAGTDADRDIYLVTFDAVRRYRLTSQGVSLQETIFGLTGGSGFICEADISPGGKYLGWGNENEVYVTLIDSWITKKITLGSYGIVYGIEFSADEEYIYISYTGPAGNGLKRWHHTMSDTHISLPESNTYNNTQLEMGKDGRIYAVRNDGVLGVISGTSVFTSPLGISVFSNTPPVVSDYYYALPDQVDGENHALFLGVPAMAFEGLNINGEEVFDFIDQNHPPLQVFNCAPIDLNTSVSGSPVGYEIHIYSTDPSTGGQVTGTGFLNYVTGGNGTPPSTIDLRCLADLINCDLFTDYINPPYNTFAVALNLRNRCGMTSSVAHFEVDDAPDEADIGLQVNNGLTGIPCNASHNISSPCPSGIYSASINLSNSNGDITFYQWEISEVDCSNGNLIGQLYSGPQVPVNGVGSLTAISLNGLVINGTTGHFANTDWLGRCLEITATVGNVCGSSTDFTYLNFDGQYLDGPNSGSGSYMQASFSGIESQLPFALQTWPNPFTEKTTLHFTLPAESPITLTVVWVTGKVFSQPYRGIVLGAEKHTLDLQALDLPPGVFSIHLTSPGFSSAVKVVKVN